MRENRTHGSEGGGTETNRSFLPLSAIILKKAETTFSSDERGAYFNLPHLLSLRLFAALCTFALKIQSGECTAKTRKTSTNVDLFSDAA